MSTGKKIGLGIVIIIAGFFALVAVTQLTLTDEDRARFQAEREAEELLVIEQALEQEREYAKVEEVLAEDDRYKYRPYWLVSDGYKELEIKGIITQDETCANLVELANEEVMELFEKFYLGLWLGGCVDNSGEYKQIMWQDGFLKYRLYWEPEDMEKNIDNR